MRRTVLLVVCSLLLPAVQAHALVISADQVVVLPDELIDDNLYATGNNIAIHGTVGGDVIAAGSSVLIDGHVLGDVLLAGGQVTVTGTVDGDIRAAGGEVLLAGPIGGDAVAAGGTVAVKSHLLKQVMLAGGTVQVDGPVDHGLSVAGGALGLNARIGGDVMARGNALTLGANADVRGGVSYSGVEPLVRATASRVDGTVVETLQSSSTTAMGAFGWLRFLAGMFVLGLLWQVLFRRFVGLASETLRTSPGRSLGVGLAVLVGAPLSLIFVLALGVLLGGWWLALVGASFYGVAVLLAVPLVALTVGTPLLTRVGFPTIRPWLTLLVSLAALTLVLQIPVLGALLGLASVLVGVGAIWLAAAKTLQHTRTAYQPGAVFPSSGLGGLAAAPRPS